MAPVAAGFIVLILTAALMGVIVGAIGGAVVWRLRVNLVLGAVLTAFAFVVTLVAEYPGSFFLRAKLVWGLPPMLLTFLIASLSARALEARTRLRPLWTTLAAFGCALSLGSMFLWLFRLDLQITIVAALVADAGLAVLIAYLALSRTSSSGEAHG